SIDQDASGQRVVGAGDPTGQGRPRAWSGGRQFVGGPAGERGGQARADSTALELLVAATQDVNGRALGIDVADRAGGRKRSREGDIVLLRRRQERLKAVVVRQGDLVELVIVAAGATDGHAEEDDADGVGHLGEGLVAAEYQLGVAGVAADRAEAVKPGG